MSSEPKGYAADRQAAEEPGIDATKDRQTGTREEHKTWTAKWMDGGGGGKGAELGDLPPARLPSACIMCPRSHASIHSLTRVVAEGGEPPQKPQTKHKGEGGGSDKGGWGRCRREI